MSNNTNGSFKKPPPPLLSSSSSASLFEQAGQQETPEPVKAALLEALERSKRNPAQNQRELKQLLKKHYGGKRFPTQFRLALWSALLDHQEEESDAALSRNIQACVKDLENQRVIKVDVERTRADLPDFRKSETQEFAMALLTYFCKSRNARYKQGLNEMLAPFIHLYLQTKANQPDGKIANPHALVYRLFTTFVDRFLPHLYADDNQPGHKNEMIALQCSFRFYELLLQYHDPEIWQLLDHNKLKPELYSSSWFMTMFAQSMPIAQCYELWEQLLLGDTALSGDFLLIPFLSVAYVCSNRAAFLRADPSDLPVLLTSKLSYHRRRNPNLANAEEGEESLILLSDVLRPSIAIANELRKHTPDVLLWEMRNTLQVISRPPLADDLYSLSRRFCATCSPEFFWMGLTGKLEDSTEIIVIDCRPRAEFAREQIRARLVFNLDAELLESPDELEIRLEAIKDSVLVGGGNNNGTMGGGPASLSRAWRWHVCVVGVSGPSINNPTLEFDFATGMAILHLIKHTLPCVCVVEGGWQHLVNRCPNPERLLEAKDAYSTPVKSQPHSSRKQYDASPHASLFTRRNGGGGGGALRSNVKSIAVDPAEQENYTGSGRASVIVSRKSRGLPLTNEDQGEEDGS